MLKAHTCFGFVMNKHDGIRSKFKHVKLIISGFCQNILDRISNRILGRFLAVIKSCFIKTRLDTVRLCNI